MIAVALLSLSHSGVERNKDSLSILNFTRKFFINSARRTGPPGQCLRCPRWALNSTGATATVYQLYVYDRQCACCLALSPSTTHAGRLYFRQFVSSMLLIVVSLHGRDDLWPTFSFYFSVGLGVLSTYRCIRNFSEVFWVSVEIEEWKRGTQLQRNDLIVPSYRSIGVWVITLILVQNLQDHLSRILPPRYPIFIIFLNWVLPHKQFKRPRLALYGVFREIEAEVSRVLGTQPTVMPQMNRDINSNLVGTKSQLSCHVLSVPR